MKKICLLIALLFAPTAAFADEAGARYLVGALCLVLVFLVFFIILQKFRMRNTVQDLFDLLEAKKTAKEFESKTAIHYDLQEVFLYFFKTLAHEASAANHCFLVRQKMLQSPDGAQKSTLADRIKPNFLSGLWAQSSQKDDNISQTEIDTTRKLHRPIRHFFGDYTEVISCIYACCELLASMCTNKLIAVDIEQLSSADAQLLLNVEVSIAEPHSEEIAAIFAQLMEPTLPETIEKLARFEQQMSRCTGVKYFIKDCSSRANCCISACYSIMIADEKPLHEVAPSYPVKALVVHENEQIARTLISNLNDFNIECLYNQSSAGIVERVSDGVNFPFRAVFIDAALFAQLESAEQNAIIDASRVNNFELAIVLRNQKAAAALRSETLEHMFFLPLPYTVDNIRAAVLAMCAQHERLLA